MNTFTRIATAFAAGAAAMYYLDPVVGRRRRALVRDKGVAATHGAGDFARSKSRYAADKLQGMVARTRSTLASAPVTDPQLRERIRARLGRIVEEPGGVTVTVLDGQVVLRGTASPSEIGEVVEAVSEMRGVRGIDNHLVEAPSGYHQLEGAAAAQAQPRQLSS